MEEEIKTLKSQMLLFKDFAADNTLHRTRQTKQMQFLSDLFLPATPELNL